MLPKLNQKGFSQIILPLFLLAAIGLSVYLVQQRTNLIPFAQTSIPNPPNGCMKVTLSNNNRYVDFKDSNDNGTGEIKSSGPEFEMFGRDNNFNGGKGEDLRKYEFKDVIYKFEAGDDEWQYIIRRGKGQGDDQKEQAGKDEFSKVTDWNKYFTCENLGYEVSSNSCLEESPGNIDNYTRVGSYDPSNPVPRAGIFPLATMSHFDRGTLIETTIKDPSGDKSQNRGTSGTNLTTGGLSASTYDGGRVVIYTRYKTGGTDIDEQGVPGTIGTAKPSYAKDNSGNLISFPVITQTDIDQIVAFVPQDPDNDNIKCTSGSTNNATSNLLDNGAACGRDNQCKSNDCSAGKCAGGTKTQGTTCVNNIDCASNKCTSGKCAASTSGGGSGGGSGSGASPSPRASGSPSPSPSASTSASPGASATASLAPGASVPPGTAPLVTLTKAEIIGFRTNFEALNSRLGSSSASGNLTIVKTIAKNELDSIVSQLPTCPDDANVGSCIDSKFRTRFDLAKTAARLSSFYGIFNGVAGICVKSDLGLNPLITATSQSNTTGRVNLCTDRLVATKIWMIFSGGAFIPILSTDTRFPSNPTCTTLPADVMSHFRNAETLFRNQSGFVENTLCDGKTSVAPGGGI